MVLEAFIVVLVAVTDADFGLAFFSTDGSMGVDDGSGGAPGNYA